MYSTVQTSRRRHPPSRTEKENGQQMPSVHPDSPTRRKLMEVQTEREAVQKRDFVKEVHALRHAQAQAESRVSELEDENNSLRTEVESLKSQTSGYQSPAYYDMVIKVMTKENEALNMVQEAYEKERIDIAARMTQLEQDVTTWRERFDAAENSVGKLHADIDSLRKENAALAGAGAAAEAERAALSRGLIEMEEQRTGEVAQLSNSLETLAEHAVGLEAQLAARDHRLLEAEATVATERARAAAHERHAQEMADKLARLDETVFHLRAESAARERDGDSHRADLETRAENAEAAAIEWETEANSVQTQLTECRQDLKATQTELEDLRAKERAAAEAVEEANEEASAALRREEVAKERLTAVLANSAEKDALIAQLKEAAAKALLERGQTDSNRSVRTSLSASTVNASLNGSAAKFADPELQAHLADLTTREAVYQAELENAVQRDEALRAEVEALRAREDEYLAEIERCRVKEDVHQFDAVGLQAKVETYEAEIRALRDALRQSHTDHDEDLTLLRDEQARVETERKAEIVGLKAALELTRAESGGQTKAAVAEAKAEWNRQLEACQKDVSAVQAAIQMASAPQAEWSAKVSQLEQLQSTAQEELEQVRQAHIASKNELALVKAERDMQKKRLAELTRENASLRAELETTELGTMVVEESLERTALGTSAPVLLPDLNEDTVLDTPSQSVNAENETTATVTDDVVVDENDDKENAVASVSSPSVSDLHPCGKCGRGYTQDRLAKHEPHCAAKGKVASRLPSIAPRTSLLSSSAVNTSLSEITKQPPKTPQRTKSIAARLSSIPEPSPRRQTSVAPASPAPPVPPRLSLTSNPDNNNECPHCQRKFNKKAIGRHMEVCAHNRHKPAPPPKTNRFADSEQNRNTPLNKRGRKRAAEAAEQKVAVEA